MTVTTLADSTTPPTDPLVLDILETADLLRCGRSTVYRLMDSGELVSVKIGARRIITHASVVAYVKRLAEAGGLDG